LDDPVSDSSSDTLIRRPFYRLDQATRERDRLLAERDALLANRARLAVDPHDQNLEVCFSFVERNMFIPEPPPERIFVGKGDFRKLGCILAKAVIEHAGLTPQSTVLNVGSGTGRLALPLTQWLVPEAEYVGVEIVIEGVSWCIDNTTPKYPNFHFVHADIQNDY
jgi:SAM-dependent methyltransferase